MRSLRIFLVGVATVTVLLFGTGAAFAEEPPLFTEPGWNTPTPSLPIGQIPGLDCKVAGNCQINPANVPDLGIGTQSGSTGSDVGSGTSTGSPSATQGTPVAATDVPAADADASSKGHKAEKASRTEDSTSSSSSGSGAGLLVAAGLAAVATGGGVVFMRRRRSHKASFAA